MKRKTSKYLSWLFLFIFLYITSYYTRLYTNYTFKLQSPDSLTRRTELGDYNRPQTRINVAIAKEELNSDQQSLLPFISTTWNHSYTVNGTIYDYLPGYRNPCWIEELPSNFSYHDNGFLSFFYKHDRSGQYRLTKKAFDSMEKLFTSRVETGENWRFRCLPSVYVAGIHKSGQYQTVYSISELFKNQITVFIEKFSCVCMYIKLSCL